MSSGGASKVRTPRLADLEPSPRNPRRILPAGLSGLTFSLAEFGDISGLTWNQRTGHMVTGHQRLRALQDKYGAELRMRRGTIRTPDGDTFRVRTVDWTEQKELAANVAANNERLGGEWTEGIGDLLDDLRAADGTIYSELLFEELRGDLGLLDSLAGTVVEDEIPEPPKKAMTKPGDLWVMGDHRVLCGDSTDGDEHNRVLGGTAPDAVITDPPYGVGVDYGSVEDSAANVEELMGQVLPLILKWPAVALTPGVPSMWTYPQPSWLMAWVHPAPAGSCPWGFAGVNPILVYGKDPYLAAGLGRRPDSLVMAADREGVEGHPTPKPLKVWVWLVERLLPRSGQTCLDPFLGSGTTIVAAEQLDRRCYGLEIDPIYCDVIVERWQNLTGGKAKRKRA